MIRSPIIAAVTAFLIVGAAAANAQVIQVDITNKDPAYAASFGGISFDINAAAATKSLTTGPCGPGPGSNVYTSFAATGGITSGSLNWNGASYGLASDNIYLDWQGACVVDLDMTLTFNNGMQFVTQDQPTGLYPVAQYNPTQELATALLASYNGPVVAGFLNQGTGEVVGNGFIASAKTASVPEPGTLALLGVGVAGVVMRRKRVGGGT